MKFIPLLLLFSLNVFALENFSDDYDQFQVDAQKDSPTLLVFGATWCGPCQRMKRNVWTNEAFLTFTDTAAVPRYYFDIDENSDVAQAWQIVGVPIWFVVQDGKVVSVKRFTPVDQVIQIIDSFLD